ncbi:HprK-related kinase B [Desulfobacter curvatus]|uniref:HprK-related kinase B n=1 Tax=Desulfobacter curvatus TaxID=2290 RepID=UPI00037CC73E|nr:HprK-related kinase B [Desulfobacter curvatus]
MSSTPSQNETACNLADLVDSLSKDVRYTEPFLLTLDDCTIEIKCSSEAFKKELTRYFLPLLGTPHGRVKIHIQAIEGPGPSLSCPLTPQKPGPGKTKIKEEWALLDTGRVVRKVNSGIIMVFGGDQNLVAGPCLSYPNQVINFINNRFIEYKLNKGGLLGHAAAVFSNGLGIAVAGFSGMGKSTLALHLMNVGADFVSNDRLVMEKTGGHLVMSGVAKWPRINPGTALNNPSLCGVLTAQEQADFKKLPQEALWRLEHKYDVMIDQCYGPARFRLNAPLDRLVLLNWRLGAGPMKSEEIKLAHHRPLLQAIMKDTGLFYLPAKGLPQNPSEDQYLDLLAPCRVLALSGGADFDQATRTIMDWLS